MGLFDYPSPYWDSVGDPALDLIDRMLTVDAEKRITIDECLEHPWLTNSDWINPADSTDGLTGQLGKLDFSKRKVQRERTLLSSINDIKVTKVIETAPGPRSGGSDQPSSPALVKVWEKNPEGKNIRMGPAKGKAKVGGKKKPGHKKNAKEEDPAGNRDLGEFMEMGGKGDMTLFGDDVTSRYLKEEVPKPK